jgi:magnesium chelatase family protein
MGGGKADCTEAQRSRYYSKISGPLLDRIDIQLDVPEVKFRDIVSKEEAESSAEIRKRVSAAREIQLARFKGRKIYANARMGPRDVRRFCAIGEEGENLLETAVTKLGFSARAYDRVLKVARTIADLAGDADIGTPHISEAIQYRMMDRMR